MVVDHPLGSPRPHMMLVAEHKEIDVVLLRALEDDLGEIVLCGAHDLPVCVHARSAQLVDKLLNGLAIHAVGIVLRGPYAEPRATDDVPPEAI